MKTKKNKASKPGLKAQNMANLKFYMQKPHTLKQKNGKLGKNRLKSRKAILYLKRELSFQNKSKKILFDKKLLKWYYSSVARA